MLCRQPTASSKCSEIRKRRQANPQSLPRISSRWEEQTSPSIPNPSCSSPAHAPTIEFAPTTNQSQLTTNIGAYRTQSQLCHATYYSYATARESNLFPSLWRLRQPQLRQSLNSKLSISHSQLPSPLPPSMPSLRQPRQQLADEDRCSQPPTPSRSLWRCLLQFGRFFP